MSDLNLNQNPNADQPQNQEDLEIGLKVLSFCIPIAGANFMNKDKAPVKAKSACTMALIGFGVGLVAQIIQRILVN